MGTELSHAEGDIVSPMKNESVLIIGGSGFVGKQVVNAFLNASKQVTVLNRGNVALKNVEQLIADRNDLNALENVLKGRQFDVVIDTNCYTPQQAQNLTQALQSVTGNIIVISSAAVYADSAIQPPSENEPTGGAAIWAEYGKEKSEMEEVYRSASDRYDQCTMLRPPYIFGADNSSDRETWFWALQAANKPILLPGKDDTQVQFIHVDDVANAIIHVSQSKRRGFDAFNVADPTILTFSQLSTLLAQVAGLEDNQIAVGDAAGNASARSWFPFRDYPCLATPERIIDELDWKPKHSLNEYFKSIFKHYQLDLLAKTMAPTETDVLILKRLGYVKE